MSVPHDQYLKYTDEQVLTETAEFHSKGNYTVHPVGQQMTTLHHLRSQDLDNLSGNELRLNILSPLRRRDNPELHGLSADHPLMRNDSCERFDYRPLSFGQLEALLVPLMAKAKSTFRRGYPSGGALYPVEVFCCNLQLDQSDWPNGADALHLLPSSRTYELLPPGSDNGKLCDAVAQASQSIGRPSWALIYMMYLPKTLFKYRYRGYRLALIESGAMSMIIDLRCKELGLKNRMWSGFTDHQITRGLGLNPALFFPACMQLVG